MRVYKKRPNYYMIDYSIDGVRKREYGGRTKMEAEYKLAKRKSEILEGNLTLGALNGKIYFREFAEDY